MNKNINKKHIPPKQNDKLYKDANNKKKSKLTKIKTKRKDSEDDEKELNSFDCKESSNNYNRQALYYTTHKISNENMNQEGNFILEKFLADAANNNQNSPTNSIHSDFTKLPVPLPRKTTFQNSSNTSSNSSKKTYSIASQKIDESNPCNDSEKLSTASGTTYNIDKNESKLGKDKNNCEEDSTSSGATYNVYISKNKIETKQMKTKRMDIKDASTISSDNGAIIVPIGDIVIHNTPTSKRLVKVVHSKKRNGYISKGKVSKSGSSEFKDFESGIKYHSTTSDDAILGSETIEQSPKEHNRKSSKIPKSKKKLKCNSTVINTDTRGKNVTAVSETDEIATKKYNKHTRNGDKTESNENIELQELSFIKEPKSKLKKHKTVEETEPKLEPAVQEKLYSYDNIVGIIVYRTDQLLLNSLINQPCVRVHIVDSVTGGYIKKSFASSIVDNDTQSTEYIEPLITKPYKLQEMRSLIPQWEELLIFNEDINYMLEYKNSIIFFEILDFLTFSAASINYPTEGANSGWHKVAWAFLKPVGKNGHLNTDQQIRLQLYKPKKYSVKNSPSKCMLHDWWSSGNLVKYPSTLHVNVKKVKSEVLKQQSAASYRELNCNILENLDHEGESLDREQNTDTETNETKSSDNKRRKNWSRITTQSCKIPNKIEARVKSGKKGCLFFKFSNDGSLLACGVADLDKYPIYVYSVFNQKDYCTFSGHQGLIYDLHWSTDDKHLISASADCTVYIWNIASKAFRPKQLLPHPTFVYCAQLNSIKSEIATGCYDHMIRIWQPKQTDSDYELTQELDGHLGYVTSLCFGKDGGLLYSSDSMGVVIEWSGNDKDWILQRTLKFRELQNTVINNIVLHPQAKRLLLFCRDSIHRMVDLSVGCVIQWYRGAFNHRVQMYACISPCGGLILTPSEDGSVCIWNTDTGILQATYMPYSSLSNDSVIPHCIQYSPQHHVIAISHHGSALPILFVVFEKNCTGVELQLRNCTGLKDKLSEKTIVYKNKYTLKARNDRRNCKEVTGVDKNVNLEVIIGKIDEVLTSARTE